jgi:hypothetical protein
MSIPDEPLKESMNKAYEKALEYYDTLSHESPLKYDIETIEGTIQWFYKIMEGRCSLQATLDFNMEKEVNNIIKLCDDYCNGIAL